MIKSIVVLLTLLSTLLFSQDASRPWERLGLSLTEWKLIQDNEMPISKVENLLKNGIGITEYFEKPWRELGMSESKWIEKRRSGLASDDIEREVRATAKDTVMQSIPPYQNNFQELDQSQETRELFSSFFFPSYRQYKRGDKVRGRIMLSLGIGSLAGCTAWSIANKQFFSLPLFVVYIPNMVWSLVDHKIYRKRKTE